MHRLNVHTPSELLDQAFGLSLSDHYWLKPKNLVFLMTKLISLKMTMNMFHLWMLPYQRIVIVFKMNLYYILQTIQQMVC